MTQINTKKVIRQVLHNAHLIPFRIEHKAPSKEDMNKIIFVKVLTNLKKIEDRKDFMVEEIGMDMTAYEDQFFEVIEDLFKMTFNKEQLALIQLYLYQLMPDKEWDGTITIENKNKEENEVEFKSPSDVWKVINSLK
jgi:hypothetical protein|tara:strand:+ start:2081 stop:2491 length:411 start_codon:yes stop_codon:yes gene_type:complete